MNFDQIFSRYVYVFFLFLFILSALKQSSKIVSSNFTKCGGGIKILYHNILTPTHPNLI